MVWIPNGQPGGFTMQELPAMVEASGKVMRGRMAYRMNAAGDIVGYCTDYSVNPSGDGRWAVWKNTTGNPAQPAYGPPIDVLPLPAGSGGSVGRFINNANQSVGAGNSRYYIWTEGAGDPIDMSGFPGMRGLNDRGESAGFLANLAGYNRPVLWLPETRYGLPSGVSELGTLGGTAGRTGTHYLNNNSAGVFIGDVINAGSSVVGWSYTAARRGDGPIHAFVCDPVRRMRDLNSLVALGLFSVLSSAASITDSGHITGTGTIPTVKKVTGGENVFLLTPTTTP